MKDIKIIEHDGIDFIFIIEKDKISTYWKKSNDVIFCNMAFCFNEFDCTDKIRIYIDGAGLNDEYYVIEIYDEPRKYLKIELKKDEMDFN